MQCFTISDTEGNREIRNMKAVIVAGGRGTRLSTLGQDLPKPMIKTGGTPVLEHQVQLLRRYGIRDISILIGHLGHVIEDYFGDGTAFDVAITYYREDVPLGTSGCLNQLRGTVHEDLLVLYGDLILEMALGDLVSFHKTKGGLATLVVHPNDHPFDSDLVVMDEQHRIVEFLLKDKKPEYYGNLANAALYVLTPQVFSYIPEGKSDFMKDVFPEMLRNSQQLYGYKTAEYLKDMGTVDRFRKVSNDLQTGRVGRLSKEHKRPAIFLDRDGTTVQDVELLHKVEDLELFPFSVSAIKKVNQSDYLCFLITNQPVVARNLCDLYTVRQIHNKLETSLGEGGAYFNDIYFCPHHPDKGYPEENPALKIDCECRKPKTGMIEKAVEEYHVDKESSWFVGDTTTDIQAGKNAGLHTVLVRTGKGGKDQKYKVTPDFIFENVEEAVDFILHGRQIYDEAIEEILSKIAGNPKRSPVIVAVGGAARAGKSTFVACLRRALKRKQISGTVISLDNWLVGAQHRDDSMTVRERYQYKEIEKDIDALLMGETILMNHYDPRSRTIIETQEFSLHDEQCLIIDGVPALDIGGLRSQSDLKIFLEVEEARRRERLVSYYRWKDLQEAEIPELYKKRQENEFPIIDSSKQYADIVIKG